ncbi:conjugal transfer pilus assembly protein TraB [Klebsiella pneumoniae]|nr:conjugal transfer pilus assembly protein TraB [Klebsiella pneumoniae]
MPTRLLPGNESTVPMQLRITGRVEMPNSKTYDLTGCFVGLEAWGDVSSERAHCPYPQYQLYQR